MLLLALVEAMQYSPEIREVKKVSQTEGRRGNQRMNY